MQAWTELKDFKWVDGYYKDPKLGRVLARFGRARLGHLESLSLNMGRHDRQVDVSALKACLQSCCRLMSLELETSFDGAHIATLLQHAPQVSDKNECDPVWLCS